MWTNFIYKRVTISYVADAHFNPALGMGEPVNLSDNEVTKGQEKPKPIKEDFSLYSGSTAAMVTVQWNDRKCAGRLGVGVQLNFTVTDENGKPVEGATALESVNAIEGAEIKQNEETVPLDSQGRGTDFVTNSAQLPRAPQMRKRWSNR